MCRFYAVEKIWVTGFCQIALNVEIWGTTSRRTILTGNYSYLVGEKQPTTSGLATTATAPKLVIYPVRTNITMDNG